MVRLMLAWLVAPGSDCDWGVLLTESLIKLEMVERAPNEYDGKENDLHPENTWLD